MRKQLIGTTLAGALLATFVGSAAGAQAPPTDECGTYTGKGCAPLSERVDLAKPTFSNPTAITNPYFPISELRSAVLLGHVDGKPFRTETTLLPGSRTVVYEGRRMDVLTSQYIAYLDGRITEAAIDLYAQADDGSVWYFGEDVFDYEDGAITVTEGTWHAGREGPAAMIMPAAPTVGDVFRLENIPGVVFEEVTVESVTETVDGPRGPVTAALIADELHADGTSEKKIYAPGYGEFRTSGGGDLEALALSVPTDALPTPLPVELQTLSTNLGGILESARLEDWESASATMKRTNAIWQALLTAKPPTMIADRLTSALRALTRAVEAKKSAPATQAAIDAAQSVLDLRLRHETPADIDVRRFELHTQQLRVHAAASDLAGVTSEVATLEWIRDRIAGDLEARALAELDAGIRDLHVAADAKNVRAAGTHAARLAERLRVLAVPEAA